MHLNYYFLDKLSAALGEKLVGFTVATCFSQERDELVLGFTNGTEDFYIKCILTSSFSALAFPSEFHRKRQNSVNLFPELIGKTVLKCVQHRFERSFYFSLSDDYTLLFKMFGNRANLVVFENAKPVDRFHKKFPDDFGLNPWAMDRDFNLIPFDFPLSLKQVQKKLPTLGDLPLSWLEERNFETSNATDQETIIKELLLKLATSEFYLIHYKEKIRLSLLPIGEIIAHYKNPIEAAQHFASKFQADRYFYSQTTQLRQTWEKQKKAAEQILADTETKQHYLQTEAKYSQTADIIMANLTLIPPHAKEANLFDFYLDKNRVVKLKSNETPQKTAEKLYKKGKNQQIELKILEEKALRKTEEIILLEEKLEALQTVSDGKELKQFLKIHALPETQKGNQPESPFREFLAEGYRILVGKSAKNNDELTQKHTFKEDLWLHAKDVSGSHVVIKYQAGKTFPVTVIEKAAQLAAYYSKRKTDTVCPVIYTPKKYVRKSKGAAAGSVIVERENVILVTPGNPFERTFS